MSSQDILFVALALAIFVVSGFFIWFLYTIIMILKDARETVAHLRLRIEELFTAIDSAKAKFQATTSTLRLLMDEISGGIHFIKKFRSKKQK